jgi:hypothetical protein
MARRLQSPNLPAGQRGCSTQVADQIASLRTLPEGWYDGAGVKFEEAGLRWIAKRIGELIDSFDLPTPHIYPAAGGTVRAEWSHPNWEIAADLDPLRRTAEARAVRLDTDAALERSFALAGQEQQAELGNFLARYLRGEA